MLDSLAVQSRRDFEVVVVDQNRDFNIRTVVDEYAGILNIHVVRSAPGLSLARNRGLEFARGEIAAFPDDDSWYPADLVHRVATFFEGNPSVAGYIGRVREPGKGDVARFKGPYGTITRERVFESAASCGLFLRTSAVVQCGGFREDMGLGSGTRWAGGEDYDLPIRMVDRGYTVVYDPDLVVFHPLVNADARTLIARGRSQAPSFGHLLVHHRFPASYVTWRLLRPLGGAVVALIQGRPMQSRFHLAVAHGRLRGALHTVRSRRGRTA